MKYKLFLLLLLVCAVGRSQVKPEREHRIKKSQFPLVQAGIVPEEARSIRYYQEVDTSNTTYILRFKIRKMKYRIDMDGSEQLQQLGFTVKEIDLPEETYTRIDTFLRNKFKKVRLQRIFQYYPATDTDAIKNTFQNLMVPSNTYQVLFKGNKKEYKAVFDADGNPVSWQEALPANYDRVLY